ncbi:hypothetical protein OAH18_01100 [bacterium]|nr:hypothetical protein [bacterium]
MDYPIYAPTSGEFLKRRRSFVVKFPSEIIDSPYSLCIGDHSVADSLPFSDVLSQEIVENALTTASVVWNDRIYTPLVTHWIFLSQVISADPDCVKFPLPASSATLPAPIFIQIWGGGG